MDFVIFDLETTGLDPQTDKIIEIGAVRLANREVVNYLSSLINPGDSIPLKAFEINRISPSILKNAPRLDKVLEEFLEFIKGSCLCSYNLDFDLAFLNRELKLLGKKINFTYLIDILSMSRRLLPGLSSYSLSSVAEALKINIVRLHRALEDALLAKEIFLYLLKELEKKGIREFTCLYRSFGYKL